MNLPRVGLVGLVTFLCSSAFSMAQSVPLSSSTRPFIWAKMSERDEILNKIDNHSWASSKRDKLIARVQGNLSSYTSNRDAYLRALPVNWSLASPRYYTTETQVNSPLRNKLDIAQDCSVIYYLTGDERYGALAADVLHNAIRWFPNTPKSSNTSIGGWTFHDREWLYESRSIGAPMPIIYDFMHGYLQNRTVYDVKTQSMVSFDFAIAQSVFKDFRNLCRDRGYADTNWCALMGDCMILNTLALDNVTTRNTYVTEFLYTDFTRQDSIKKQNSHFDGPAPYSCYPESLGYSKGVVERDSYYISLLDRYDPSKNYPAAFPKLIQSLHRTKQMHFPNISYQVQFGDGHRLTGGGIDYHLADILYSQAKKQGRTDQMAINGGLLADGIASGKYNRSNLSTPDSLGIRDQILPLLWGTPVINETPKALDIFRTDTLPYAGLALQRNFSPNGNVDDAMMCFVQGAGFVHSHASGMNMELYGEGKVLGVKGYGRDLYARSFASANTVIVNGYSRGAGGWSGIGINTVQVEAMEPAARQNGVSPNISFTCTSFLDNKGDGAEATQERTMAVIRTSPTTGYYFDLFRSDSSKSGEYHDYLYHNIGTSLSVKDSTGAALSLSSQPNRFQNDTDSKKSPGWGYLKDTKASSTVTDSVRAQFATPFSGSPTIYMNMHIPGDSGREYATAMGPSDGEHPSPYHNKDIPTLIVRRNGQAWNNPFAVIFEPHSDGINGGTVQNVTTLTKSGKVVGLKVDSIVDGMGVTQYIFSNTGVTDTYDDPGVGLSFKGRFGIATMRANGSGELYLGQGSKIGFGNFSLVSQSGNNTQASVIFSPGQAPVITSNAPVNFSNPTELSISNISDQTVSQNTSTSALPFIVSGGSSPVNSLTITGTSSNTALVPNSAVVLGGSGANRTVTITPAAGQMGTTIITLQVSDGNSSVNTSFKVTVAGILLSNAADASVKEDLRAVEQTNATTLLGAGGNSPWVDRCTVYVFQLPNLGAIANPFATASFTFNYSSKDGTIKNNDLYGLGRRDSATVLGSDYYGQSSTADPTDATRLQTNILTDGTAFGLISTSGGGADSLLNYLNSQYASGAGVGKYVFLRLNTAAAKTGINRGTLTMSAGGVASPTDTRPRILFTANTAPTISTLTDLTINQNTVTPALPFSVGDAETSVDALTVSAISSNTTVIPNANIVIAGSGADRTVQITPATDQSGESLITLEVSDGGRTASTSFMLTVLPPGAVTNVLTNDTAGTTVDWLCPPGVTSIQVECWGGGGAGGGGFKTGTATTANAGGGGGAGGAYARNANVPVTPGNTYTLTVGPAAVASGTVVNGVREPDGATTTFTGNNAVSVIAVGGQGGESVVGATVAGFGGTATSAGCVGDVVFAGGNGAQGAGSSSGGGGGAAGDSNPGGDAVSTTKGSGGASVLGDPGGDGGNGKSGQGNGFNGNSPGGGAGGGRSQTQNVGYRGGTGGAGRITITYSTLPITNTPPSISDIADRNIAVNASTGSIPFTIGDQETDPASLNLTKESSNPALVPNGNIVFGGSGVNRNVTVTPAANQLGTSTIRVTVSDGDEELAVTATFVVTVTGSVQETWRFTHFGSTANGGEGADESDANHDGENNLLEFATGQDPNASTRLITPLEHAGSNLVFRYSRGKRALAGGMSFQVKWSDTLAPASWSAAGVVDVPDPGIPDTAEQEFRKVTLPAGTGGRRFVHLTFTDP